MARIVKASNYYVTGMHHYVADGTIVCAVKCEGSGTGSSGDDMPDDPAMYHGNDQLIRMTGCDLVQTSLHPFL